MIVLFTDFGLEGPYLGQVKATLHREAPGVAVIDLFSDAPAFDPRASAYLLAAYVEAFPPESVFLAVVDPGVGTAWRRPVVLRAMERWLVGPDNGLFQVVASRAQDAAMWDIAWRPERLSATFHGRDLFAPVAARLARGEVPPGERAELASRLHDDWPADLAEIVYIDRYGNAMTGLRAALLPGGTRLKVNRQTVGRTRTFGDVPVGEATWYENSNGLAEIAVNRGHAAERLGLHVGMPVEILQRKG